MGLEQFLDHTSIKKLKQVLATIIRVYTHKSQGLELDKEDHKETKGKDIVLLDARDILLEISRFLHEYKRHKYVSQALTNACLVYVLSFVLYACNHIQVYMHTTNIQVRNFQLVSIKYHGPSPVENKGYLHQLPRRKAETAHAGTRASMSMATFINLQAVETCQDLMTESCPKLSYFTVDVTDAWFRDRVNNMPVFYQRVSCNEILAERLLQKLKHLTNAKNNEQTIQLLAIKTSTGLYKFESVLAQNNKYPSHSTLTYFVVFK
jgi:hypothetical protein